jgi:hypothetical protein
LLPKKDDNKLSYEETYKAIAQEDWTDFDQTLLDGLGKVHYSFDMRFIYLT